MKHIEMRCIACNKNSNHMRPISCENLNGLHLCNECNLNLIKNGWIRLNKEVILKITGKKGDFYTTKAVVKETPKKLGYWESRKRVDELNQMSGFPSDNGVHGSY